MKKVNFNPLNSERIDNLRKEYLDQILAHPVCRKFIDKYDIKEDEINRNTSKFVKVIEDHKICTNCPGLNNCPKALKGIHFELDLDEDTFIALSFVNDNLFFAKQHGYIQELSLT